MRSFLLCLVFASFVATTFAAAAEKEYFHYHPDAVWTGACAEGKGQSPINIVTADALEAEKDDAIEITNMGVVSDSTVYFNGAALTVTFNDFSTPTEATVVANNLTVGNSTTVKFGDPLKVTPLQMHFHTFSEHTIDGMYAPAELHIVTIVNEGESDYCDTLTPGCLAVFGIMLPFDGEGKAGTKAIDRLFKKMPEGVGADNYGVKLKGEIDLNDLLPESREYYSYEGSLTTPGCNEIVSWHVFEHPNYISKSAFNAHQMLVSYTGGDDCQQSYRGVCVPPREKTNHRDIQPLNGRVVYYHA